MASPIRLTKILVARPEITTLEGVVLRKYVGEEDIDGWLNIRNSTFNAQKSPQIPWQMEDFEREFLRKTWWKPERMWFADIHDENGRPRSVGTITWGESGVGPRKSQTVQWLAVLPEWRGRGIGRMLLATLEAACWDAGYREIRLETLSTWQAAMRLYEAAVYRPGESR